MSCAIKLPFVLQPSSMDNSSSKFDFNFALIIASLKRVVKGEITI